MTSTGFLLVGFYRPQTKLRKGNVFTPVCQSFCLQRGVCPVHARIHPPSLGRQPPPTDGHCRRRYASYWNAFLLSISLKTVSKTVFHISLLWHSTATTLYIFSTFLATEIFRVCCFSRRTCSFALIWD